MSGNLFLLCPFPTCSLHSVLHVQESVAFTRFLHRFVLPGPLVYVPLSDTMVTCNSEMCVEAYKYANLAASTEEVRPVSGPWGSNLTLLRP
jgi:PTHB1-like protein involved in ciliary biogenesis